MTLDRASSDLAVSIVDFGRWLTSTDPEIKAISQLTILDDLKAALLSYGQEIQAGAPPPLPCPACGASGRNQHYANCPALAPSAVPLCSATTTAFNNHYVRCDRLRHVDNNHAVKLQGDRGPFSITWQSRSTEFGQKP